MTYSRTPSAILDKVGFFESVCLSALFCLSPGDKQIVCPQGTNIFALKGWEKHFYIEVGGQTFYVGGSGGYYDVYEEMDVSEVSKLSAGARILRDP